MATRPGAPLEVRRQLFFYFSGHALWIDPEWLPAYEAELNKGTPDSALAVGAAEHVQRIVPQAQEVLGAQFRAIVNPKS